MPRFFTAEPVTDTCVLRGETALHIAKSLRMKCGEALTLCDGTGMDYEGVITGVSPQEVMVSIARRYQCEQEPDTAVTLYQCLPKGDKMEWIVQKTVELGVCSIVPVLSSRCIARPDQKSAVKKQERYQRIALEAAQQSGRGCIPRVKPMVTLEQACASAQALDVSLVLYEKGGQPLHALLAEKKPRSIGVWVGPEGGFAEEEISRLEQVGVRPATLGKRILRTETAPIAALAVLMHLTGNLE